MLFKMNNCTFSYGADTILKNVDFELRDGEKIAICGRNGCGKTTLIKLITGELEPETNVDDKSVGMITKIGINNIGYLKQIVFTDDNITMEQEVLKVFSDIMQKEKEIENLRKVMDDNPSEANIKNFVEAEQKFKDMGGYFYKKDYSALIKVFKFSEDDKNKKINEFSGGQKTKIAFIKLLLSKPDILIFDEPTNHLDIDSIEWLEEYLAEYPKSVIVVSHDRDFLDKVANVVYEIEYKKVKRYSGNYTDYVRQKQEDYDKNLKEYKSQQQFIKKEQELIDKFRYKATKASMVQSRIKALDKIELVDSPQKGDNRTFHFNLKCDQSGREVLKINNLCFGYDSVLGSVTLDVMREDRIGIIGGNGIGKSTFLKTIAGKIKALGGNYTYGYNTKIGYFEQLADKHTSTKTVFEDYIEDVNITDNQARSELGAFLFSGDDIEKRLCDLSGGEMVRLQLLKIFRSNPSVLLLDEPTNHMDLAGKEQLEKILSGYNGTLIVVSHDRYFIKKVTKSVLYFGSKIVYYPDGYNEYLSKREKVEVKTVKEEKRLTQSNIDYQRGKERAKRERAKKNLEEKISFTENKIDELNQKINTAEVYENVEKMLSMNEEINLLKSTLDDLYNQWYDMEVEDGN